MMSPTEFRDLVSGRRQGAAASALRGLLRTVEVPYTLAMLVRNRRYDRGRTCVHHVSVPVISVGNLSLGGTGKTPMVKWVARTLQDSGARVTIVSRGYGAKAGHQNDEALELAQALPNVPHVQNRNRAAAARKAIEQFDPSVLLLDDGFQHRRLARDLDIVLLDALEPFGFEHVFPRGTLREPLAGLARADVICLSRADTITTPEREAIRRRVARLAPQAAWCELAHTASKLINFSGESRTLDFVKGRRVAAFCGIGNPAGFRHTLAATGCDVATWREFPDHCTFTPKDLAELASAIKESGVDTVVCTQKDLVKVEQDHLGEIPLWAVAIDMQFLSGQEALEQTLERVARKG